MIRFILGRLLAGLVLVLVISALTFAMLYANSENIARRILGQQATQDLIERKTEELGLNRPLWQQYGDWVVNALQGNFGRSWFTGELVSEGVSNRLIVTLTLVLGATLIAAIVAVVLSVLAAVRGGWIDRVVQIISIIGFALPGFLLALGLVLIFAINLGWFNATGYTPITEDVGAWSRSIVLPITALALGTVSVVTQQVRGAILDGLNRDYVRTLRSRGLGLNKIVLKHILRNAGGPALSVLAVQFIGLLGGAVIVEQVFAIPGIGQLAVSSTVKADIPMVMGLVLVTAIIVVLVNLLIDLSQAALNPKVRM
ncbi:peptide/nickel transport system permease protein [Aurantimicrobium minutum]|uniref:ABC transporter permease n=1 Tax=Aurantimicrobium minutum TaxID=708131 RepID=UPI0024765655|nr:ABC transporter permease [Aurantimicrobium minutum]MDH6532555.1 peptide/nickel transport system permease protein [Aurantimicrobium minutum]